MFKNIQKQLLLKHPLLWNTKFVPMLIIGLFLNLLYFLIGYADGTINFKERYDSDIDFTFFSFCFLISLIITILWLVNYFKNNSFKSFYPKSKYSLFFEWIQVLTIVFLLIGFYFPFEYGRKLHKRNYVTEEIAKKRCETISKADFFIDGNFDQPEIDSLKSVFHDTVINGTPKYTDIVYKDYIMLFGKKYPAISIINRNVAEFSLLSHQQDSIHKLEVQLLLHENKSHEVKKIMADYLAIIKEHHLLTNLDANKWFEITYNYPDFNKYELINPYAPNDSEKDLYPNDYNDYESAVVSDGNTKNYSKYFIERNTLVHNYQEIATAYTNPVYAPEAVLVFCYFAFAISLLIFSFRVTSGKSWLIAIVGLGILNFVLGIFAAISSEFLAYSIMMILCIVLFAVYLLNTMITKTKQKFSKIILNLFLWLFGALIPLTYFAYQEFYKKSISHIEEYYYDPHYVALKEHEPTMLILNVCFVFIAMFFLCSSIKNWKGISED